MSETKTIVLRKPLKHGKDDAETVVSEITIREPLAGDYEKAEQSSGVYGTSVALIALLSSVPVDVIDQMYGSLIDKVPKSSVRGLCARDFLEAVAYFNGF